MTEPQDIQTTEQAIEMAQKTGMIVLPAVLGIAYGIYLLAAVDSLNTNGWLLTISGVITLLTVPLARRTKVALVPAYLLGVYMFGSIGCVALALAISERSGWQVFVLAMIWIILGWRALAGAARLRRV